MEDITKRGTLTHKAVALLVAIVLAIGLTPFPLGGEAYAGDLAAGVLATQEDDPITSFTYELSKPLYLWENSDGEWASSIDGGGPEDGDDWFYYSCNWSPSQHTFPMYGDALTVTRASGKETTYTFGDYENDDESIYEVFFTPDGDIIRFFNEFRVDDNQSYYNQWTVGNTYDVTITSWENENITSTVQATVVKRGAIDDQHYGIPSTYTPLNRDIATEVKIGEDHQPIEVSGADAWKWFKIEPDQTATYEFRSFDCMAGDPYADLYRLVDDGDEQYLVKLKECDNDELGDEGQYFSFSYELNEGETYYLACTNSGGLGVSDYYISMSLQDESDLNITGIEYEPIQPYVLKANQDGQWENDSEYGEWFRYILPNQVGDELILNYSDGSSIHYKLEFEGEDTNQWRYVNTTDPDDVIDYGLVDFNYGQTAENPWEPGNTYRVYAHYEDFYSDSGFDVEVVEDDNSDDEPITAFTYEQSSPITLVEEVNGSWVPSNYEGGPENGDDWFHYDYDFPSEGDVLTVTRESGTEEVYKYGWGSDDGEAYYSDFFTDNGKRLNFWEHFYLTHTQSYEHPWVAGNSYELHLVYKDNESLTANLTITIEPNPIKAIEFIPAEPYTLVEEVDGETVIGYEYDEELGESFERPYFMYRWSAVGGQGNYDNGDKLIVTKADGTTSTYVYSFANEYDEWMFTNEDDEDDSINTIDVFMTTDQALDNVWAVGKHSATVTYSGRTSVVPVEVVENTVDSIEYLYTGKTDLIDGYDSWIDTERIWNEETEEYDSIVFTRYNVPSNYGDVLTINSGAQSKSYKLQYVGDEDDGESLYVNVNDPSDVIKSDKVYFNDDQSANNQWEPGPHQVIVTYMGRTYTLNVTVAPNPVDSIEFTPSAPIQLVDYYDADQNGIYSNSVQIINLGDVLTVHYNDGRGSVRYEYGTIVEDDGEREGFVDSRGNTLDYGFDCNTNETDEHPWSIDADDMFAYVNYMNKTCEIPVTIIENPVKSIEFNPVTSYRAVEDVDGYEEEVYDADDNPTGETWFHYGLPDYYADAREYDFHEGDELTIHFKDESSKTYTYSEIKFFDEEGNQLPSNYNRRLDTLSDQSKDSPWNPGMHEFTLTYMGASCEVPIEVVANDVKSISYEYASDTELMEDIDGWECNDSVYNDETDEWEDIEWFRYAVGMNEGDVLVVTTKEDKEKRYMLTAVEADDEWVRYYENIEDPSDRINYEEVFFNDGQSPESPWEAGNQYTMTVTYRNKQWPIEVSVVPNPIASISYEYTGKTKFYEGLDCSKTYSRIYNEDTDEYEEYEWYEYCPVTKDGDKITITYTDKTKSPQTYERRRISNPDGEWDQHVFVNVNDPTDELDSSEIYLSSDESYEHQWGIGSHDVIANYMNRTCKIPVSVEENPVEAIEYTPVSNYVALNEENSYEEEEYDGDELVGTWTWYDHDFMFRSGDKLTITYKNGAKTYIYDSDTETFLNNGVELEESENYFIGWHDDQSYENQWSPSDSSNAHIYVTYMGRTSNPVSLKFEQTIEVPEIDNDSFTYNGKPQGPEVAASNAYTVSGAKQTNAGEYTVTLTCNDGYIFETGSTVETFDWWINPLEIEKPAGKLLTYSGKAQVGVAQGEGYEVSGNIATNAGKYVAQVACDNNHVFASGETRAEIPYEIAKANISKAIVVLDKNSSPYTGKLQKGTVKSVTLGLDTLVEGTDYIVNAKSGTAAKQYSVTVTGKGNYTGSVSATFVVTKVSISSVGMQNCVYKGEANLPAPVPTVKAGSNVLKNATDFTYSVAYNKGHDNGKYVGPATVTVTGKGNCTGKIVKNFKITTVADSKTVGAKLNEKTLSAIEKVKTGAGAVKQANSDTMETIAKPRAKTMTVKWKKVDGATNYIVGYKRSTDKNWSYVVSGGKTEYTFSKMAEGGLLEFRVAVYDGTKFARSEWTRINCRFYREMVSLKAVAGKGKISLNWGKVSGATGYQVLIATKENMSDAETVSVEGGSALKYTVMKYGKSKLKAGKTYYVKVRPIKYEANALGKKNTYVGINSLARKCPVK